MNVWFERNKDVDRRCFFCKGSIEIDSLVEIVTKLQRDNRNLYFFHPQCFIGFVEKIFEKHGSTREYSKIRKEISGRLRAIAKSYYTLAAKPNLSDFDRITLYTYRLKSRLLSNELAANGGPLVNRGMDSILFAKKPLWLSDDKEYTEWEGFDILKLYSNVTTEDFKDALEPSL